MAHVILLVKETCTSRETGTLGTGRTSKADHFAMGKKSHDDRFYLRVRSSIEQMARP